MRAYSARPPSRPIHAQRPLHFQGTRVTSCVSKQFNALSRANNSDTSLTDTMSDTSSSSANAGSFFIFPPVRDEHTRHDSRNVQFILPFRSRGATFGRYFKNLERRAFFIYRNNSPKPERDRTPILQHSSRLIACFVPLAIRRTQPSLPRTVFRGFLEREDFEGLNS